MDPTLLISVSGIRAIGLRADVARDVAVAFAQVRCAQGDLVAVADDGRPSGAELRRAVLRGLAQGGACGVDLGTCPTPVLKHAVAYGPYAGGVVVTASHNPLEWNGLKLVRSDGRFLSEADGRAVMDAFGRRAQLPLPAMRGGGRGVRSTHEGRPPIAARHFDPGDPLAAHRNGLVAAVDSERIRRARFRVAVDACNASASRAAPELLRALGCEVVEVFCDGSGIFPRQAEPLPEHLGALADAVRRGGAAVGFALDPDGDRCALVAEDGTVPSEECTLALCVRHVLGRTRGPVVLNTATSYMAEVLGRDAGCRVVRAPVGEVHVADAILEHRAVIGGEGNGGVIWPVVGLSRDGLVAMALLLDLLAQTAQPASALVAALPPSAMVKRKVPVAPQACAAALDRVAAAYAGCAPEPIPDGRKWWLGEPGGPPWLLVRVSNTEPVMRVLVETTRREEAEHLADEAEALIHHSA